MVKKAYPSYYKSLMDESIYPSAKRRIKYEETHNSHLFRAGDYIYKIQRTRAEENLAIKERFATETLQIGKRWAPEVVEELLPLHSREDGTFGFGPPGELVDFVLKSVQVSENYWLHKQIAKGKFTPTAVGRLARYLAEQHTAHPAADGGADAGRPEHLHELADEVFYQAKKYTDKALPEQLLNVVSLPFFRFVTENRKLFQRRQKKGRIVECHGAFLPEHIFLRSREIFAISPVAGHQKYRILDAANDVALLTNALELLGEKETQALFVKRYGTAARDRDLDRLLPVFQTFQAMRMGLMYCEWQAEEGVSDDQKHEWLHLAQTYYNLAATRARSIPRD